MLTEGRRRMRETLDPEATDARAHASQLEIAERLGGREHLESLLESMETGVSSLQDYMKKEQAI